MGSGGDDDRLSDLLEQLTETYRSNAAFRRTLTSRKVEGFLPALTDFATISTSSSRSDTVRPQRKAAADWLQALLDLGKHGNNLNNQVRSFSPTARQIKSLLTFSVEAHPRAVGDCRCSLETAFCFDGLVTHGHERFFTGTTYLFILLRFITHKPLRDNTTPFYSVIAHWLLASATIDRSGSDFPSSPIHHRAARAAQACSDQRERARRRPRQECRVEVDHHPDRLSETFQNDTREVCLSSQC